MQKERHLEDLNPGRVQRGEKDTSGGWARVAIALLDVSEFCLLQESLSMSSFSTRDSLLTVH